MRNFLLMATAVLGWSMSLPALADCTLPATPNDGYFDQAWAGNGCIVFDSDNRDSTRSGEVDRLDIAANGDIFIGGYTSTAAGFSWWIGELTPGGAFDANFGDSDASGRITGCQMYLPGACPGELQEFEFLPQPDNKILILSPGYLARTNAGGHAFDAAGVAGGSGHVTPSFQVATPAGTLSADFGGLALAASGRIWMTGYGTIPSSITLLGGLARLNSDLSLDTSFHAATVDAETYAGGQFVNTGDDTKERQVLLQSTGKPVLIGTKYNDDLRVSRLNVDGSLDTSFGNQGTTVLTTPPAPCSSTYYPLIPHRPAAKDRADRIVLTGECYSSAVSNYITVVVRLTADGDLDTMFGNAGYYVNSTFAACPSNLVVPRAIAIDSAGRILVGGGCDSQFAVQRLRGDHGTLDTSFGIDGLAHGHFDPTSVSDQVEAMVFDGSGHLFIGGYADPSAAGLRAGVARLTYDLIYTNDLESAPRGCLPPNCN
jgi:uncharacterized delta-60 repeat protein